MTEPKIKNNFLMPNVMNKYQDILATWLRACSQENDCEDCPYAGIEGDCDLMWSYLDDYAIQHKSGGGLMMEHRIRQMQIKNTGKMKLEEVKREEVFVQCTNCKYQETVTLLDGKLSEEFDKKFELRRGKIFHECYDGVLRPCQKIGEKK